MIGSGTLPGFCEAILDYALPDHTQYHAPGDSLNSLATYLQFPILSLAVPPRSRAGAAGDGPGGAGWARAAGGQRRRGRWKRPFEFPIRYWVPGRNRTKTYGSELSPL